MIVFRRLYFFFICPLRGVADTALPISLATLRVGSPLIWRGRARTAMWLRWKRLPTAEL